MRKIREVLRLSLELRLSDRDIAKSVVLSRRTVGKYLSRARVAGLSWPLPEGLDDSKLENLLYPPQVTLPKHPTMPDWGQVNRELRKHKRATLQLLWEEYRSATPDGIGYSRFCDLYRSWAKKVDVVLRQEHKAGEMLYVDYAGDTVPVFDHIYQTMRPAQIFVAVLGASSYTYAEATWSQTLPDWIGSHVRALEFLGGVTAAVVPDNLKSGVTKPCYYEPELNPTYQDWASHYGTAVLPTRVRKPRDKAKVEVGVQVVERWILARLRNRQFFSLEDLNKAIWSLLKALNERPFRKMPGSSRRSLFEALDRPALRPLPNLRYEFAQWHRARVSVDCHVSVNKHLYSAPYHLVGHLLDARSTARTVELFHKGQRVASHLRNDAPNQYTTQKDHLPPAHRFRDWTPDRLIQWAAKVGPHTAKAAQSILDSRDYAVHGYRSCLGLMRLSKTYDAARMEAACQRAVALHAVSYTRIAQMLKAGLDKRPLPTDSSTSPLVASHANIRGAQYYSQTTTPDSPAQERSSC